MRKRIYAAISHHGLGHLGQLAPVLNAFSVAFPDTQWLIQSGIPQEILQNRLAFRFDHLPEPADIGMCMHNALDIDVPATYAAYQALHGAWDEYAARTVGWLEEAQPDLVISNVGYLPLWAAQHCGIPSVALCSLNWYDIFRAYWADQHDADQVLRHMLSSYSKATHFLVPTPGMPMRDFANVRFIGPLARLGQRISLQHKCRLPESIRFVMVSLGGIPFHINWGDWPVDPGIIWLVPDSTIASRRADMIAWSELDVPFIDVLASCDALITKPGYGMFSEAACHGIPVLYCRRKDWPEEPWLVDWLQQVARTGEITREAIATGDILASLSSLWALSDKSAVVPTGVQDAVSVLADLLNNHPPGHQVSGQKATVAD